MKVLVVGAGPSGCTAARTLAELGRDVLLIEKRAHVGGNTYDEYDEHGVFVHRHGSHIFHTNCDRIWNFVSRFSEWRLYEHRVLASVGGAKFPIPVNPAKLGLSRTGVIDKFYRGYSRKQWGMEWEELPPEVTSRVPMRDHDDDRYFTDKYQGIPKDGYTKLFECMVDHPKIQVRLGNTYIAPDGKCPYGCCKDIGHVVYTGPIDHFFWYQFGKLPYRSLRFEYEHIDEGTFQPVAVVNYPNEHEFTRIHEYKHLTGQKHKGTTIAREYPTDHGDPYYPMPTAEAKAQYAKYKDMADKQTDVTFIGRLAEYRYYNMDQAIGSALSKINARFGSCSQLHAS